MAPPRRILSLAPSNTEILFALGLGDSLVGVTEYCRHPPEARLKPALRGWVSIPPEKILELDPDLAVTSGLCQEALRRRLEAAGVKLLHLDPRDLAGVRESFLELGRATGREAQARELAERFDAEGTAVRRDAQGVRLRLYCEEWQKPPSVSGNWVPELAYAAGADYFPLPPGEPSRPLRPGEIQAFDPQIVILSICGMGLKPDPSEILGRPGWEDLEALREKRVVTLDDSLLNCPGPRLWEGARALQEVLQAYRMGEVPPASTGRRNL
ncbi:MAG TPA: ABC transporter substrate-binding protein [bacterium]|nr:ABC transporter substrate-binding protein [bacterium]